MLDLKYVLANLETVREKTAQRGAQFDFDAIVALDTKRRAAILEVETLQQQRNEASKKIGMMKKAGEDITAVSAEMRAVSDRAALLDKERAAIEEELSGLMMVIPNLVDDSIPVGTDEESNTVYKVVGEKRELPFAAKEHFDVAEALGMVDFERGVKIAQARFSVLTGLGARLERALVSFMLDTHTAKGYTEVMTPFLVNATAMTGTGQLPKFSEELFTCERDGLYLIPTAEVPVTNLYNNELLEADQLPVHHAAFSPCFRREAGSYGKDTRGLIRQHQFNKVELVKVVRPETSAAELEALLEDAERILQLLGLHYRVVTLCTGDIGFSAAKTYDIEVWLPGQNAYREISSCSNFKDFQARRAGIRFREKGGKPQFAHTLNGSGLAVGRTMVAILENYQQEDGSVVIPEVLRPYMGGLDVIRKG